MVLPLLAAAHVACELEVQVTWSNPLAQYDRLTLLSLVAEIAISYPRVVGTRYLVLLLILTHFSPCSAARKIDLETTSPFSVQEFAFLCVFVQSTKNGPLGRSDAVAVTSPSHLHHLLLTSESFQNIPSTAPSQDAVHHGDHGAPGHRLSCCVSFSLLLASMY